MKRAILLFTSVIIALAAIAVSSCGNGKSTKDKVFVCPEGEPFAVRIVEGGRVQIAFNDTLCAMMCEMNSATWHNPHREAIDGYENLVNGISDVEQAIIENPSGDVNPTLYMRTRNGNVSVLRIMKLLSSEKDADEAFRCSEPLDYVSKAVDVKLDYDEYGEPLVVAVTKNGTKVPVILYDY